MYYIVLYDNIERWFLHMFKELNKIFKEIVSIIKNRNKIDVESLYELDLNDFENELNNIEENKYYSKYGVNRY